MIDQYAIDQAYEDLINSIVKRAVDDYMDLLMGDPPTIHKNMKELMNFFYGSWFTYMCDLDTDAFLDVVRDRLRTMMLIYDVVKEKGSSSNYYIVHVDNGKHPLEGPYKTKQKALHRAADLQGVDYSEYMRLRRKAMRNDKD